MKKVASLLLVGLAIFCIAGVENPPGVPNPMTGNLDGGGYTISNVTITGDGSGLTNLPAGGASMTGFTLVVNSGEWGGEEPLLGSTTNNGVVWAGYSTANATNNGDSGDAWYSSAGNILQDRYFFAFAAAPAVATKIGGDGIVFLTRTSSTDTNFNHINMLVDSQGGAITSILDMVSDSADTWNAYQLTAANLPAAWTSAVPTVTHDGIAVRGLNVRVDAFVSNTNYAQTKMLIDWD